MLATNQSLTPSAISAFVAVWIVIKKISILFIESIILAML